MLESKINYAKFKKMSNWSLERVRKEAKRRGVNLEKAYDLVPDWGQRIEVCNAIISYIDGYNAAKGEYQIKKNTEPTEGKYLVTLVNTPVRKRFFITATHDQMIIIDRFCKMASIDLDIITNIDGLNHLHFNE